MRHEIGSCMEKRYWGGGYPSLGSRCHQSGTSRGVGGQRLRRALLASLFLFLSSFLPLFPSSIKWSWVTDDADVRYYRWQSGGEDDDAWTVVDSTVTSVVLPVGEEGGTLSVQASYDGVNWSESARETYSPPAGKEEGTDRSARRWELSFTLVPYSGQHVWYSGGRTPDERSSRYGAGGGVGLSYNLGGRLSLGTSLAWQWHDYADFHSYSDLKLSLFMRYKVLESKSRIFRTYLSHSVGADFVLRDDGDKYAYALLGIIGIQEEMRVSGGLSLNMGLDAACTFQSGSAVLHLTPYLGMAHHYGGRAE